MSYCMFENTSHEMAQILAAMREADSDGEPLDLSSSEKNAFENLKRQCALFLEAAEYVEYAYDNDNWNDRSAYQDCPK